MPRDEHAFIGGGGLLQIELSWPIYRDEHLIETFRRGEDIHTRTAAGVWGSAGSCHRTCAAKR